jgi:hypothetical protein
VFRKLIGNGIWGYYKKEFNPLKISIVFKNSTGLIRNLLGS